MNAVRLFCYSELTLYQGRGGKYRLQQADLIASFWGVTESMETYALCCYLAELTSHMTDTEEDSPAAARLLLYALHALAEQKRDRLTVKAAFELRLMAESGYEPEISRCAVSRWGTVPGFLRVTACAAARPAPSVWVHRAMSG